MQEPSKNKSDDSKDSIYEELEQGFYIFPKYGMKIVLGGFNAKVGVGGEYFQTDKQEWEP